MLSYRPVSRVGLVSSELVKTSPDPRPLGDVKWDKISDFHSWASFVYTSSDPADRHLPSNLSYKDNVDRLQSHFKTVLNS